MSRNVHEQAATITSACLLEVLAPKVGNVHPGASFDDLSANSFIEASLAISGPLAQARQGEIGSAVARAVEAMCDSVGTNTHLGIILLLAPLVAAEPLDQDTVAQVLRQLSAADASHVYRAIRMANPGGLGRSRQYDVSADPPEDLLAAMQVAAERDLVARQYSTAYADVFHRVVPRLTAGSEPVLVRIRRIHIELLAELGDSLIARKCGERVAEAAREQACRIVDQWREGRAADDLVDRLDCWLRSDGHQRNPGATADLIAAGLYVALRNGLLQS